MSVVKLVLGILTAFFVMAVLPYLIVSVLILIGVSNNG